ncbi:hydroxyacylglutathione hydrolase [Pseudovibrio sp. Tun.PSC04-5.I4]|uniref:hydroxyacylglutathione hydrolase n=1 Tax=Pseudovibrio sp. Tun.PSC04-5.I4 TaxID=1798213 RepID=UPI00088E8EAE|nr:hydroxyacylglutathione hydrolase [Pseudovibrio sp. Tun.PSC04-5.I4]SDR28010.1 hydroxyacylglutathione hydrolase [Pseudovibrio sp. Tun.PSC04-5.I4]
MIEVEVRQFSCLKDNFGVLIHHPESGSTVAIDVPEAAPYLEVLKETGWKLTDILITHHHWDHVGGLTELSEKTGAKVTGPERARQHLTGLNKFVEDGDDILVGPIAVKAIGTPGHTLDHISWWFQEAGIAHTGDTLFALGCGRVFEGDAEMMWASLSHLANTLPPETTIYCGHEYTLANAKFALTIDPNNQALQERTKRIEALREVGRPTLPTSMAAELSTNPFLRVRDAEIQKTLNMVDADPADIFAEIRRRKDIF